MADNSNGFKVAFWVMSAIAVVGLAGVVNAVVANDRLRASEDLRIETQARINIGEVEKFYYSIDKRLGRIEDKLQIVQKESANYLR